MAELNKSIPDTPSESVPEAPPSCNEAPAPNGSPAPNNKPEDEDAGTTDIRSLALTGIFLLALFYTLYFAKPFLLPIVLALILNFTLRPVYVLLTRIHIPGLAAAALIVLALIGIVGFSAYELSIPASHWIAQTPSVIAKVQKKMLSIRASFKKVSNVAEQVQKMTEGNEGTQPLQEVRMKGENPAFGFISHTREAAMGLFTVTILLFFLLAYEDLFLRKLIKVMQTFAAKKKARVITRDIEQLVSRYLATVTMINAGLGAAMAIAFFFVGFPNPILFGVMVFLLNFIPYLGALTGMIIVTLVGLVTFDTIGHALIAPLIYLAVAGLEGSVVTPAILGRQFTLNPAVIFIWLVFWGWMWGIPGALLAVPMLTTLRIFCENYEPLHVLGEFLGD